VTEHKSLKRLVRAQMERTGESYTAARAMLLRAEEPADSTVPRLKTSDEKIRERTGRGWEEWFAILDEWGAQDRSHREIARWVAEQQGVAPLAWNAQAVVASYELTRGLREVGEKEDGFAITASRTVAAPVERVYDAFADESLRRRWLPDAPLSERTASRAPSDRRRADDRRAGLRPGPCAHLLPRQARNGGASRCATAAVRRALDRGRAGSRHGDDRACAHPRGGADRPACSGSYSPDMISRAFALRRDTSLATSLP
jgi:hypothetical protein